jgi:uncharacterized protein YprB with RNaseH-like and TPR domain
MSLTDKLSRIIGQEKPKTPKIEASTLDQYIRGEWSNVGSMKVFQVENSFTSDMAKLKLDRISEVLEIDCPDPQKMLFFDTETTGLAGGTGTYAFLVGLGFFSGSRFLVLQLFMPGFADEPAMLQMLSDIASSFTHLVSFNGKMFDQPLLSTRFTLSRIDDPLRGKPHIDLLHLSRPVWKRRLDSCSLKSLEANILGHRRDDDIDGALIPEVYFNWLRTGEPGKLPDVFTHNQQDVASMVKLLEVVGSVFGNPESPHFEHPVEMLGIARYMENHGKPEHAKDMLSKAVDSSDRQTRDEALTKLGMLHKKNGQFKLAVECFEKVSHTTNHSVNALCELAKHYEHREKNFDLALDCTNRAISVSRDRAMLGFSDEDFTKLKKRADRLASKKNRMQSNNNRQ